KSNVQAIFEKSNQQFNGNTSYFVEEAKYQFSEYQTTKARTVGSTLSLTASKNLERFYFNNDLSLEYEQEDADALVHSNNNFFDLSRHYATKGFRNKLDYVPALKNGDIIQFSWVTNYGS